MSNLRSIWAVLFTAVLSSFLYFRGRELLMIYTNAPSRLPEINAFARHEIKFADQVRSCEDVLVLEGRGLALLACDPGRERWNTVMGIFLPGPVVSASLYVYDYKDASRPDASSLRHVDVVDFAGKADFHTLGMAYDEETSTLFAANHAKAGPRIEVFNLDLDQLVATHAGTIQHPLIHGPNSIALVSSREFYVSNDHYFLARQSRLLSRAETFLGLPLGTVVHVKLSKDKPADVEEAKVVARVGFANGVEILNSTTVAVAATSQSAVYLYERRQNASLAYKKSIQLPFLPDNLSVHGGKLIIAGHPHFPSLVKFTATRHICNDAAELAKANDEMRQYCREGKAASWAAEWSEEDGLKNLYVGTEYPSSATAARDSRRGVGIISGLYAKGILVLRD
ncbi:Six-bladed beta-propeller, TolB-like protein [Metarhizium album ARSEF 1941]|uniref:Six-bladed beta-propeller, TolB-like protein n=1 Tax=Metarhizium album (strain ARSEF 1941) TaxID=1081103 RepID=A0A0B2WSK5_METAS|nr:Six-bladed beta-propeller, TolB-like protein [Metarhizium album ARSEF 1941]KHN95935.1 Six-bladed beta-propeller, TolB-like protein [Metarhizium album ARSEF 1941]